MKYIVRGETMAYIDLIVDAENAEEAAKKVSSWVSMLGGDRSNSASIHFSGDVDWTDMTEY